jgi:muramoyltetrapeptide carboxypeptidase
MSYIQSSCDDVMRPEKREESRMVAAQEDIARRFRMSGSRRDFIRRSTLAALALPVVPLSGTERSEASDRVEVILPPRLREGATIGLIAPAGAVFNHERLQGVYDDLESIGLKARLAPNALAVRGYLAGTDQQRADDLHTMIADDSIDAIVALRGGWGVARMLPLLDYDLIRRYPKIIMGYSDITSLLIAIYARSGLVTFHGPVGISTWNEHNNAYVRSVLFDGERTHMQNPVPEEYPVDPSTRIRTIVRGTARGRLIGGNLTVLTGMIGSDFVPDLGGHILFLEDIREEAYRVDRMLTHLKLAGVLDAVEGVVWGHCTRCDPDRLDRSLSLQQVLDDHFRDLGKPVFYGSAIGHIRDKWTVPVGVEAEMDSVAGTITLLEPAVR